MASQVDPLFLAVAQPVLRSAAGEPLSVQPALREAWAAQPLPPALRERLRWCLAHSAPHEPVPWWAGHDRIVALVDGHRPLTLQPVHPWAADGPPSDAPYPAVLSVAAGGLQLFFVNASIAPDGRTRSCVRVFAVDGQQAVEAEPVPDAQLFDVWAADGAVWACGLHSRSTDASGTGHFGHGLLLRFSLRPLKLAERQGGAQWLEVPAAAEASGQALREHLQGVEAWVAHVQDAQGLHWLLGAPLAPLHFSPDSPLWMPGPMTPSDHADLVLAQWAPGRTPVLSRLALGWRWVGACHSAQPSAQRWYLARGGLSKLGGLNVGDLAVAMPLDGGGPAEVLQAVQPLRIEGLPRTVLERPLADLDVIHDPRFGYAASLAWLAPDVPGRLAPEVQGALMRSADGVRWEVVSPSAGPLPSSG